MYDATELFIDGAMVAPTGGETVDVIEAATEQVMGHVALAGPSDVDAAVAAARRGQREWAALGPQGRAEVLHRFADAYGRRAEQTATLVSRQNGMPITRSRIVNGSYPESLTRYYADLVRDQSGPDLRSGLGGNATLVLKQPVGTVAAITPWNYPQTLAMMKIAPALAAGCSVVLKPAPETSLDAYVLAEAAIEAGLPAGVLNVIPGGRDVGSQLVEHRGIDKVAFTGSTAAGRTIGQVCGRLLRPATLELGGKSAAIVLDDADLDQFTSKVLRVSLPNGGQTCHSNTRILASRSRYDEVVEALTETVRAIRVGDPLDESTEMGPMVSANQRSIVLDYVAEGLAGGARLTTGGGVPEGLDRGWFVEPTVFADVDNSMRIAQEEIFGPVLCVIPYRDEDEAVQIANDSDFGLGGTVWTADEHHGIEIGRRVETGSFGVNHYGLDPAAPFGGVKGSGVGRELGPEGLEAYLVPKSLYLPSGGPTATAHATSSQRSSR